MFAENVNESQLLQVPAEVGVHILQQLPLATRLRVLSTNNQIRQKYLPFFTQEITTERKRLELLSGIMSKADALDYCDMEDVTHFQIEYLVKHLDKFSKPDLISMLADMIFHGAYDELPLFKSTRELIAGMSDDSYSYASYECLNKLTYSDLQGIENDIQAD